MGIFDKKLLERFQGDIQEFTKLHKEILERVNDNIKGIIFLYQIQENFINKINDSDILKEKIIIPNEIKNHFRLE